MSVTTRTAMARLIVWLLTLCMLLSTLPPVRAQGGDGQGGGTGISIATAQCERPPLCFASVEARQSWARDNNCYFLEDVCSEAPQDDGGARAEDRGFWGSLWDKGVAGIKYGYNFLRGLFDGLKDQIEGIVELITNAADVVKGLIELGKAFYNDPEGTTMALAELMGQGAVNLITRATECGPYDLGRVIGEWVSPAVMVRVATRLGRYGDDVVAAVRNTKRDLGCASFAAGTLIWTEDGLAPIERVGIGERLLARDDRLWHDAPQRVAMTFERVAPNYHELRTELETYRVTDEHPLWVQGKGWTEVSQITEQDVLVLRHGDARVLANTRVDEPVEVYNFTVENTPNYFVGEHGLWAHNCDIPFPYKAPVSPSGYRVGASDGGPGAWRRPGRGPEDAHSRYETQITGAPHGTEYAVKGVDFDGYDASRGVLIEAKHYTRDNPMVKGYPPSARDSIAAEAIAQARRQVIAAEGRPIEWHVATKEGADAIRDLLYHAGEDTRVINVIFSADISG